MTLQAIQQNLGKCNREAEKTYYNKKILESNNKCKTTWGIINEISGHQHPKINMQDIKD